MYAIRSYYADHHVGARFLDRDPDLAVDREGARELALGDDVAEAEAAARITSYNVCYTKLLRGAGAATCAAGRPIRATARIASR